MKTNIKHLKNFILIPIILFCFYLMLACGDEADIEFGEVYPELVSSGALLVTATNHPDGWGRENCSLCHNYNNIHLVNRLGIPLDLEGIRELTFIGGDSTCPSCHGTNGTD